MTRWCVAIAAALLLAGCTGAQAAGPGTSSPTPPPPSNELATMTTGREMLAASVRAAEKAESVRVVIVDQKPTVAVRGNVDVTLAKGKGAFGVVTIGGGTLQFIATPTKAWWRADDIFWREQAAPSNIARLQGKWIAVGPDDPGFSDFLSYGDFNLAIDTFLAADGPLDVGPTTQVVSGVRSQVVATKDGTGIAVAADGPALPVRIAGTQGETDFSNWNSPVAIEEPAPSTVVPYSYIRQIG